MFRVHLSDPEKVILSMTGGLSVLIWIVLAFFGLAWYYPLTAADALPVLPATATAVVLLPADTPSPTVPPLIDPTDFVTPTAHIEPTPPADTRLLPLGQDTQVIALLGIDEKHDASVWRTDTIMLAFVQPQAKRITLLSIPRDLWVYIPDHGYNRINTVDALGERTHYPGGGRGLLDQTLRYNLGIPVDHFVRLDFKGFVDVVDTLGGVTVYVEKPLTDKFPDPLSATGWSTITLPVGPMHMDGHTALSYCRSRMTTDDFDRSRRQQQVLKALWEQAFTPQVIKRAPQLWNQMSSSFDTDISMIDAILLAKMFQGVDPKNVRSKSLDTQTARPWTTPEGAQVLLPQKEAIQQVVLDLLAESGE